MVGTAGPAMLASTSKLSVSGLKRSESEDSITTLVLDGVLPDAMPTASFCLVMTAIMKFLVKYDEAETFN